MPQIIRIFFIVVLFAVLSGSRTCGTHARIIRNHFQTYQIILHETYKQTVLYNRDMMTHWWLMHQGLKASQTNIINQGQRAENGAGWRATSRVSTLQFTALTSLIWVTWGNALMTVSWVCFNSVWVGGPTRLGRDSTLMNSAVNGWFDRTTNILFFFAVPGKHPIRSCCVFIWGF